MKGLTRTGTRAITRQNLKFLIIAAVALAIYAGAVSPYVINSSFSATEQVVSSTPVSVSQLPAAAGYYLESGQSYSLLILSPLGSNESRAVVYSDAVPAGSLVHVSSSIQEWNVQPYSVSIAGHSGFDMLVIASALSVVPTAAAEAELSLTSSGTTILRLSTLMALANPIYFLGVAWFTSRRLRLWMVVGVAWVYSVTFVAADLLGSSYGLYPSFILLVAAVVLLPGAYLANMLETSIRGRLASNP